MQIKAFRANWTDTIDVAIYEKRLDGGMDLARPLEFISMAPGAAFPEPTLKLTNTEAQLLMDELWGCGLRPSEGTGSAGSLLATQNHLKDMQTITFKLLEKHVI